jgi:hypothetical protein
MIDKTQLCERQWAEMPPGALNRQNCKQPASLSRCDPQYVVRLVAYLEVRLEPLRALVVLRIRKSVDQLLPVLSKAVKS